MALLKLHFQRPAAVLFAVMLWTSRSGSALDLGAADEYRLKAAFLLNFLKFTEWPDLPSGEPLSIGLVLPDPFGSELDSAARATNIGGRRVEVRRFRTLGDVRGCQLLFVPQDAKYAPADLPKPGRLTVGETPEFLSSGGIISFYLDNGRVRFEISPSAAQLAGVRIHARVLELGVRNRTAP